MAPVSFSPTASISSHTLSLQSNQPPHMDLQNGTVPPLVSSLSTEPHTFLQPSRNLHSAALALAKQYLDPLASSISESQAQRQKEIRQKRKRGDYDEEDVKVLALKKVHLDGFNANQVWEQARRVLEATCAEVERSIPTAQKGRDITSGSRNDLSNGVEEDSELSDEELDDDESLGEEGVDWEYDGIDGEQDDLDQEDMDEASEEDGLSGDEDIEMEEGDLESDDESRDEQAETFVADPNNLNDGFFSIDNFNRQSEFLEQQDVRGEAAASDDEEVDWDADPFTAAAGKASTKGEGGEFSEEEDDEDAGPTFGNVDLNAPEGESEDDEPLEEGEMDDMGGMTNANDLMYADFFAPPARKAGKNKKKKARSNLPSSRDPQNADQAQEDDQIERTMSAVRRELWEDSDEAESDDALSDVDPADPRSRRSAHERRQAKIAEEIRRLEAANVAKRDWTLSGEARAVDRPMNSLLEEDLDFERAGKPIPVITQEVSDDIESLIKRRILANEFDEVQRRRPDDLATGPRRGRFELDDTKSGKGLAEIYEEDHLRQNDPNFVDARDERLKKEHAEIEAMWKSISSKLDSLSSWHYKPKPVAPSLEVRVDAPAIEMEDARPTAGGDVAGASMLAPQEVYKPGEQRSKEEIVTKGGMPVAREEMTREQKVRRRRREKERIKKAGLNEPTDSKTDKKVKEKKQMLGDLKRGGVKVIGKTGQITDVEGKEVKDKARLGGGSFKL